MTENKEQNIQIVADPNKLIGYWANFAQISHSIHEFTLDFVRLEPGMERGILVTRVSVSPLFITQLIEALTQNWDKYAETAIPHEVRNNESADSKDPNNK